jgi:hypothetical protein
MSKIAVCRVAKCCKMRKPCKVRKFCTFGPKMVAISARNTKVYKMCELCKAIFSAFYNVNFATKLCNFTHCGDFFASPCLFLKLVYNRNCVFSLALLTYWLACLLTYLLTYLLTDFLKQILS